MSEHTPDTEEVAYYYEGPDLDAGDRRAAFERWLAETIRQAKAEAWAEGTRETAAYIERLYPAGLVNRADVLADMKIAEDRQSRGIHANGRDRADEMEKEATYVQST